MAADDIPDWGVVPYVSQSVIDSMSSNADRAYYIHTHGNTPLYHVSSGAIDTGFSLVWLTDSVARLAVYKDDRSRYAVVVASMAPFTDGVYWVESNISSSSNNTSINKVTTSTQYIDMYYLTAAPYRWSVSDSSYFSNYYVYESRSAAVAALYESFDGSGGGGGGGGSGGDLFVASVYNSSPIGIGKLADNVLGDSNFTWLNSSYDIEDGAYTPVAEILAPSGYQVRPMRNNASAQYLCWADYSYSAADYASISVSGDFTFYIQSTAQTVAGTTETRRLYPSSAVLAINGDPYYSAGGNLYSGGVYSVNATIPLSDTGDIYSIGVWAYFDDTILDATLYVAADVGFYASNNLVISTTDYVAPVYPEDPTIGDVLPDLSGLQNGINQNNRQNNTIIQTLFNLPSNIANGVGHLFIPQHMADYRDLYGNLLQDKLGFVWQAGTMVADFSSSLVDTMTSDISPYEFSFGPVAVPMNGDSYVILSETDVDLDNDFMDVLRPVLDTIVCLVCTLAFFNTCRDMMISLLSGASYMEYLGRREEEINRDY